MTSVNHSTVSTAFCDNKPLRRKSYYEFQSLASRLDRKRRSEYRPCDRRNIARQQSEIRIGQRDRLASTRSGALFISVLPDELRFYPSNARRRPRSAGHSRVV